MIIKHTRLAKYIFLLPLCDMIFNYAIAFSNRREAWILTAYMLIYDK